MESKTFEDILYFLRDEPFSDFQIQLLKDILDKRKSSSIFIFKTSEDAKESHDIWKRDFPNLDLKFYKYEKCRGCSEDWGCKCSDAWAVEVVLRKDVGFCKTWVPLK